jgi:Mrp family chromosome partitioning ATPase
MNTLLGLLAETPSAAEQPRVTPIREQAQRPAVSPTASVNDEQIRALVQQLFFRRESKPVRRVGFLPIEASTETATLCLDVASALAEEDSYDVGLIDAHPDSVPLQTKLQIPSPNRGESSWPMAPRLWMVPRQSWLPDACGQRIAEQNLSRLRELTTEFDFSILWCAPASWLTASIGQTCDGLVLVLAANKTRRLVAAQIKDQLSKAQVPLLGTVLAERRFPVPQGLYRSL